MVVEFLVRWLVGSREMRFDRWVGGTAGHTFGIEKCVVTLAGGTVRRGENGILEVGVCCLVAVVVLVVNEVVLIAKLLGTMETVC